MQVAKKVLPTFLLVFRMMKFYTSNRNETLVDHLARVVGAPLNSPFSKELILVQTQGMSQWLKLELSRRLGVLLNAEFPFTRIFVSELMQQLLPEHPVVMEPEALTWRVMSEVKAHLDEPEFLELKDYLDDDLRKQFQLAERIAGLFDQYGVYRPPFKTRGAGMDFGTGWQKILWDKIVTAESPSQGALIVDFIEAIRKADLSQLPERLSVFGVTSLPPIYLNIFQELGKRIPFHFFWMSPCREYWGDIKDKREKRKLREKAGDYHCTDADLHLESGHALLASWGKTGRAFHELILDLETSEEMAVWEEETKPSDLLHFLQNGILSLNDGDSFEIKPIDRSLQIHSCHSPLRELQVLRDHMLEWFSHDKDLNPDDILVMLPDVEAYAPFVKAVFGANEEGGIPVTLVDRGGRQESPLIDGFIALLRLHGSRLKASDVVALFETDSVHRRFEIDESELEQVRQWVRNSGIRWGRDAAHLESLGLPGDDEHHSWAHGKKRLLLGYALADGTGIVDGCLPCDGIDGSLLLGRWLEYQSVLFGILDQFKVDRTLSGWADYLNESLVKLFLPSPVEELAAGSIRLKLDGLRQQQKAAGYDEEVPFEVILERILPQFDEESPGKALLRGAVPFAGLKPLSGVPFKVICILGLNDGEFPKQSRPLSFDLMAKKPQLGDPNSRNEDRYFFLESLLSARERFYISYLGQSSRDNSSRPPSVVVSELLDYIGSRCSLSNGNAEELHRFILTTHRFHPFSAAYFEVANGDPHLFSYSKSYAEISRHLHSGIPGEQFSGFIQKGKVPEEFKRVGLEDLQSFYKNPSKFFIKRVMGFSLPEDNELLSDEEMFAPNKLEEYQLKSELLNQLIVNGSIPDCLEDLWRAGGKVAPGNIGSLTTRDLVVEVESVRKKVSEVVCGAKAETRKFDFTVSLEAKLELRVSGKLNLYAGRLIQYRAADVDKKPNPQLEFWLAHLVYHAGLSEGEAGAISYLIGDDKTFQLDPFEKTAALELLKPFLVHYWEGLQQPLRFFPKSSFAYLPKPSKKPKSGNLETDDSGDLGAASKKWNGSDFDRGECDDPYFNLCFRNDPEPLNSEFELIAKDLIPSIRDNIKEGK